VANNSGQLVPLADHRNSIVGTFSTALQNIDQIAEYDPHGRVTLRNSDEVIVCEEAGNAGIVCDAPSGLPFGFASALRSDVTGLVYMRNRWYSPRLGQFITHDPLGYIDAHNLYAYVAFDPINFLDPYGLKSTGGFGGNTLTQAEADKFGQSRDPEYEPDLENIAKGAAKQQFNDTLDEANMAVCMFSSLACEINKHTNLIDRYKLDDPEQKMGGDLLTTLKFATAILGATGVRFKIPKMRINLLPKKPKKPKPLKPKPFFKETFDNLEDATGQLTDLKRIEIHGTNHVEIHTAGYTEKYMGFNPKTGEWHSAFFNPQTNKFGGGHWSSRND